MNKLSILATSAIAALLAQTGRSTGDFEKIQSTTFCEEKLFELYNLNSSLFENVGFDAEQAQVKNCWQQVAEGTNYWFELSNYEIQLAHPLETNSFNDKTMVEN